MRKMEGGVTKGLEKCKHVRRGRSGEKYGNKEVEGEGPGHQMGSES